MKIELDDDDHNRFKHDLCNYAYNFLKEDTKQIIKEQFKILCLQEFGKIAKETVDEILSKEKDMLKDMILKCLKNRAHKGQGAPYWYNTENIVKNIIESKVDKILPDILRENINIVEDLIHEQFNQLIESEVKSRIVKVFNL